MSRIVVEPSLFSVITTSVSESGQLLIKKKKLKKGVEISPRPERFHSELHRVGKVLFRRCSHRAGERVACLGALFTN